MPASSSGNSPATKQVTGSNRICAPVPEVSAKTGPAGACGSAGGAWPSAGGAGAGAWPSAGGSCSTAEATATSSTSALATRPSATATRTGAWPTVSPAWLSVVTAYSPAGAAAVKPPSSPEVARTTDARLQLDEGDGHARERPALEPHDALDRAGGRRRAHVPRGEGEKEREKAGGSAAHGTRPTQG